MTVDEIKEKLDFYGINYKHSAKKEELEKLLEEAQEHMAQFTEEKEQPEELPGELMTVSCDLLNLRSQPDDELRPETVCGKLKRGETVRVVEIENGWAQIMGGTYCKAEFLE